MYRLHRWHRNKLPFAAAGHRSAYSVNKRDGPSYGCNKELIRWTSFTSLSSSSSFFTVFLSFFFVSLLRLVPLSQWTGARFPLFFSGFAKSGLSKTQQGAVCPLTACSRREREEQVTCSFLLLISVQQKERSNFFSHLRVTKWHTIADREKEWARSEKREEREREERESESPFCFYQCESVDAHVALVSFYCRQWVTRSK